MVGEISGCTWLSSAPLTASEIDPENRLAMKLRTSPAMPLQTFRFPRLMFVENCSVVALTFGRPVCGSFTMVNATVVSAVTAELPTEMLQSTSTRQPAVWACAVALAVRSRWSLSFPSCGVIVTLVTVRWTMPLLIVALFESNRQLNVWVGPIVGIAIELGTTYGICASM